MRKLIVVLACLSAFAATVAGAAPATTAATVNVTITKAGFVPSTVTINEGDSVTWTNTDTADHQIVINKLQLSSPVLHTGQSFTGTFKAAGNYSYQDGLNKKLKGTVDVKAAPPPPPAPQSITIAASASRVIYGGSVRLSGTVSNHQAGENVTISAQPYGQASFSQLAAATTLDGGAWSVAVKPTIRTVYQARWKSATSSNVQVGVRPRVGFGVVTGLTFSTKVTAARSFAGKVVLFQRRNSFGQWISLKRVVLNSLSAARFKGPVPHGNSRLRVFMSVNQAGPGYLAGISRTIVFHRA